MKKVRFANNMLRKNFIKKFRGVGAIKVWNKGIGMTRNFLNGRTFLVYTGNKFVKIVLDRNMERKVLGEFCITKRITGEIHSKTQKSK